MTFRKPTDRFPGSWVTRRKVATAVVKIDIGPIQSSCIDTTLTRHTACNQKDDVDVRSRHKHHDRNSISSPRATARRALSRPSPKPSLQRLSAQGEDRSLPISCLVSHVNLESAFPISPFGPRFAVRLGL